MKNKIALITGITGQDGSYLTELLLSKGYKVHGLVRRSSAGYGNLRNIIHLVENDKIYRKKLILHAGDLTDGSSIFRIIKEVMPDEVYNLGAMADVAESFLMPEYSIDVDGIGVVRILEAIRQLKPDTKFYQASTSELFGNPKVVPQNENTLMNPQSPYAFGKHVGFYATKLYREAYDIFACNGILFNHESERRGDDFLTRKVTKAIARIKVGLQKELRLGNMEAKRDWGYSKEFVECMWLMLQQDKPDDYVVGTGETHTVEEWTRGVFNLAGLKYEDHVVIDDKLKRTAEVWVLLADPYKAKKKLGWKAKVKFKELMKIMYDHDLQLAQNEISR